MSFLGARDVVPYFESYGFNSSHFVWLIGDFQFFRAKSDLVLAYKLRGGVLFLALEPLGSELSKARVADAVTELSQELSFSHLLWISVYSEFIRTLQSLDFKTIPIGREPCLDLATPVATGKAARGVKSARNQAIRAGCVIEEWSGVESEALNALFESWKDSRWLFLGGFLNSADPLAHRRFRKYFVARNAAGVQVAYLIATQIPATGGYFFEDLVRNDEAPNGVCELLTLTACERLRAQGVKQVSLGVVSGFSAKACEGRIRSWRFQFASRCLEKIYNVGGLETFRKRFKPNDWLWIYLAAKRVDAQPIGVFDWVKIFWNLFLIFEPKLRYRRGHGRSAPHSMASTNSAKLGA